MWSRVFWLLLVVGCVGRADGVRYAVSVAPLAWVVGGLTGEEVLVVVPPGTSPESYEPTARQIEALAQAELFFSVGLIDFEQRLEPRLQSVAPDVAFVRLADSLDLLGGGCGHHSHLDPHVWLAPHQMRRIVGLVADRIGPQTFARRDSLYGVIDGLDRKIKQNLGSVRDVAIVHPSLGYFCAQYGLTQHAIEIDGKEPSGVRIRALADTLRGRGVRTLLYSVQDPQRAASALARELDGRLVPFDPMARAWDTNLEQVSLSLCNR